MKKRFLSVFLALALCLTLLPTAALADTTPSGTALTESNIDSDRILAGGTAEEPARYYLSGDVTLSDWIKVNGYVTLDLNGFTLTGPSDSAALVVGSTDSSGHLTLKDSSADKTGKVTNNDGKTINVYNGSLTLMSGTVSCTSTSSGGYAISVGENSTVTLKGGTVSASSGNKAISLPYGSSSLYADGGTVEGLVINWGTITRSSNSVTTATTFNGTVINYGTNGRIEWGTFNGTVENGYKNGFEYYSGTISGGTFYGTVTNLAYNNTYGTLDNSNGTITNNGVFVFQSGYKVDGTDITDSANAEAASAFISGLNLSGTGYVDVQSGSGSDTTHSYYSHSGTSITDPGTKAVVTFDLNGGTGTIPPQGIYDEGKATKPADPTRDGYTFGGWYEKENGAFKATAFDFDTAITTNTTLYAKWTLKTYTVTYNSGVNGTGTVVAGTKTHGEDFTLSRETFARFGYTQTGWATSDGGEKLYNLGGSYTADAAVTLYPVWTQNSSGGGGSSRPSYAITVPETEHGTVKVSHRYAERGDTVTITVTPDSGYTLETLTVLDRNGNEIELTDKGDGKYTFKMPSGKVEVKATFAEDNSMLNFFVDVTADQYYYDAVLWAAKNGITGGVDENHFGPDLSCTRAQLVTFLWRAAGCPVVNYAMNFSDVGDDYYTEAVRWAASLGIVGGYGNGLFGSDDTITREQFVTILYRFAVAMGYGGHQYPQLQRCVRGQRVRDPGLPVGHRRGRCAGRRRQPHSQSELHTCPNRDDALSSAGRIMESP